MTADMADLVACLPKCAACGAPATFDSGWAFVCDDHSEPRDPQWRGELLHAQPLRRILNGNADGLH